MKDITKDEAFLTFVNCSIENVGVNAIRHQSQEKVAEEAKLLTAKIMKFITIYNETQIHE